MESETKVCQNCKKDFVIEANDFAFYEKLKVPAPTFCFPCRIQRRMAFRNERTLYRRACNAPGHEEQMISVFAPDNPQRVYDHAAWWGDTWDGTTYGRDVDFSRPFFEQIKELWREVPDIALLNINPVNSEYCSITEGNKIAIWYLVEILTKIPCIPRTFSAARSPWTPIGLPMVSSITRPSTVFPVRD